MVSTLDTAIRQRASVCVRESSPLRLEEVTCEPGEDEEEREAGSAVGLVVLPQLGQAEHGLRAKGEDPEKLRAQERERELELELQLRRDSGGRRELQLR